MKMKIQKALYIFEKAGDKKIKEALEELEKARKKYEHQIKFWKGTEGLQWMCSKNGFTLNEIEDHIK